ncbi:MAG TPA: tRNA epoxyqueuosine(34) reductase QueG [Longimicrobiales bacterium]|nr:tRNA epoxyqueuosine(34) reductase QueG [Longimicrobiales bacterium]
MSDTTSLAARLKAEAHRLGFELAGVAPLRESDHGALYEAWLAAGRHGEMAYLARPDAVAARLDPRSRWPELRCALVVGQVYAPEDEGDDADPSRGIVARYARGRDYHKVVKGKLMALLRWLEAELGRELPAAHAYVDTGPVLERELARRAGLGWFGRNTLLINPRLGSYLFLGSLLLEIELEPDAPFEPDRCGTCSACVSACPTGALLGRDSSGAPVMDARRCISYLTIEQRGPIPRELRTAIGNRIYGCDICQEVCPWNGEKFVGITAEPEYRSRRRGDGSGTGRGTGTGTTPGSLAGTDGPALIELMGMDEAAWDEFSRGSAVRRARRAGFLRNVAVALGNWGAPEAVPELVRALEDPEPLVRGHAAWALGRIGTAEARAALEARRGVERDAQVREEVTLAIGERPV